MRVVFDTNVLVSALLKPAGIPALAVAMSRHRRIQSVSSTAILNEFRRVLLEKLRFDPVLAESAIEIFIEHSEMVKPRRILRVIKTDPADNRILECAVEGRVDMIVTGDQHLLVVKIFRKIPILTVREFFDLIHKT